MSKLLIEVHKCLSRFETNQIVPFEQFAFQAFIAVNKQKKYLRHTIRLIIGQKMVSAII